MRIGDRKLLSGTVCAALKDTIRLRHLLLDLLLLVLQLVALSCVCVRASASSRPRRCAVAPIITLCGNAMARVAHQAHP
jgi:hypothetical protein